MARPEYLILGRITKVHGVRGEVRVALYADGWAPFAGLSRCWVGPSGGPYRLTRVESEADREGWVALKLAGIDSPEAAAPLVGHEVAIPRTDAPPPPAGAYYHYDILGLEVVAEERPLGVVREILETKAHDVYVVGGAAGDWFLPATRAHIRRIDLAAGRIEVDPAADLDGLAAGWPKRETGSEAV